DLLNVLGEPEMPIEQSGVVADSPLLVARPAMVQEALARLLERNRHRAARLDAILCGCEESPCRPPRIRERQVWITAKRLQPSIFTVHHHEGLAARGAAEAEAGCGLVPVRGLPLLRQRELAHADVSQFGSHRLVSF